MKLRPEHCSVHTHSTCCDGKDTLERMAEAAYAAGVKYFGASCHSQTPIVSDIGFVLPVDPSHYRSQVLALREKYAGCMEVLLGLEWDSYSDMDPAGFDYWIGSVHYQRSDSGRYYAADWSLEHFVHCRSEMWGGDALAVTEGYYDQVARVAAMKPTILGHLDLITKLNAGNRLFDENCDRYRQAALGALHAADPKATLLEINTGGMSRGYRDHPYPALFLLKEWRDMGGKVILTSDSHQADTMIYGYKEAAEVAKAAGFTHSTILTLSGQVECELM